LDFLEFILGSNPLRLILDLVGMALENPLSVGGPDFRDSGLLGDTKDCVWVYVW
jgi:hypothetical protein